MSKQQNTRGWNTRLNSKIFPFALGGKKIIKLVPKGACSILANSGIPPGFFLQYQIYVPCMCPETCLKSLYTYTGIILTRNMKYIYFWTLKFSLHLTVKRLL